MKLLKELIKNFLTMREEDVLDHFSKFPGAIKATDKKWVYIQGKRQDRVLLVAHADTVHDNKILADVLWLGDVAMRESGRKMSWGGHNGGALGADDRAGIAMLHTLYDGQHSLLITTGEERGCVGAQAAAKDIPELLRQHQFAVEIDRRGDRQAVFYDVATKAFEEYILEQAKLHDIDGQAWEKEPGSSTDIRILCPNLGICGVNFSAGYWNEHSSNEMLLLGAWLHTKTMLRRLLLQKEIPQFTFRRPRYEYHRGSRWDRGWMGGWESERDREQEGMGRMVAIGGKGASAGSSYRPNNLDEKETAKVLKQLWMAVNEKGIGDKGKKKTTRRIVEAFNTGRITALTTGELLFTLYKDKVEAMKQFDFYAFGENTLDRQDARDGIDIEAAASGDPHDALTEHAVQAEKPQACKKCFVVIRQPRDHTMYCPEHPDNIGRVERLQTALHPGTEQDRCKECGAYRPKRSGDHLLSCSSYYSSMVRGNPTTYCCHRCSKCGRNWKHIQVKRLCDWIHEADCPACSPVVVGMTLVKERITLQAQVGHNMATPVIETTDGEFVYNPSGSVIRE